MSGQLVLLALLVVPVPLVAVIAILRGYDMTIVITRRRGG